MNSSAILNTLPAPVQAAIGTYARESHLTPETVIEVALAHFLELDASSWEAASLWAAIDRYAAEAEMPPEFVIELAVAHFLDPDSVTFDDCQVGVQREQVNLLKRYREAQRATAA